MISELPETQFPGPLFFDKGDGAGLNGPWGADKGVMLPSSTVDPRQSLHTSAFKASPNAMQGLLEGRSDPTRLMLSSLKAATNKQVKSSISGGK
eukprot:CAMPEP_0171090116 /NCGR_PEP_ID=MMETSP0766_2-20121228/29010_1 /TAXON_ID=439317 /ORGANISM="Gambierdiscus australes, Strain CAWD 149" /LENGTH=93 /DNA_ID=CAMNT_0011548075 /DNA_START=73 /DNA_END=354 /DNA_ORIENTATION=-